MNYSPETTGIAPYTTALARHLAAAGHEVTVVAGYPHYPEWRLHPGYERRTPSSNDGAVRLLRVRHPVPRNPTGVARAWMELLFACRAAPRLLREHPEVIVAVSPALLSLAPALFMRRLRGCRLGVIVQDLYGAALSETGIGGSVVAKAASRLELAMLQRVDGVVVIHEVFRRRLVSAGMSRDRIDVIPNWSHVTMEHINDRAAIRLTMGWKPDEFIALHAGNMGAKQGLEGLIEVARLAEAKGSSVRIVLMGDGSQKKTLAEAAMGVKRITMMDPLPSGRFESTLAAADCLLLHEKPGVREMSVPSKLTTYFAAGRPIVAATHPASGASALIHAAQAGLTVPSGDADVMLDAIERLKTRPHEADTYGLNGRRYAAQHLTATAALTKQENWVRHLAMQRSGSAGAT